MTLNVKNYFDIDRFFKEAYPIAIFIPPPRHTMKNLLPFKTPKLQTLTHIVAIVGVIIAVLNFWHLKKIESARLVIEFDKSLKSGPTYSKILDTIADEKPLLRENGGKFSVADIDRYLGELELINNFYDHGLISEEMLYDIFSYDIEKAYCNQEIQQYLHKVRTAEKQPDLFLGFEQLSKKLLALDKENCSSQSLLTIRAVNMRRN